MEGTESVTERETHEIVLRQVVHRFGDDWRTESIHRFAPTFGLSTASDIIISSGKRVRCAGTDESVIQTAVSLLESVLEGARQHYVIHDKSMMCISHTITSLGVHSWSIKLKKGPEPTEPWLCIGTGTIEINKIIE